MARLTWEKAQQIRERVSQGATVRSLMLEYQTSNTVIYNVLKGKTFAQPAQTQTPRAKWKKLSPEDVNTIRQLRSEGWLLREIAAKFNVSTATVSHIIRHP